MRGEIAQQYAKILMNTFEVAGPVCGSDDEIAIAGMFQEAIDEAMKPAADVEELAIKIRQAVAKHVTLWKERALDFPNELLGEAGVYIQSFLTAHDAAKDVEIERLRSILSKVQMYVGQSECSFEADAGAYQACYRNLIDLCMDALKGDSDDLGKR